MRSAANPSPIRAAWRLGASSDAEQFRRDLQRRNALVALEWTVLRFTRADLHERPGYVIATIRRILATGRSGTELPAW